MPVPAPNKLFQLLASGLAKELRDRRLVLIFDPAAELRPFLDEVATKVPQPGGFGTIEPWRGRACSSCGWPWSRSWPPSALSRC
jgi:hypothetical protein